MEHWANKYVGTSWFTESDEGVQRSCMLLLFHILRQEKEYKIRREEVEILRNLSPNWEEETPNLFVDCVLEYGKVVKLNCLREFDLAIFKIRDVIRHVGVMTDNYGSFVHQMEKYPACVSKLSNPLWARRFYFGIRLH